MPTPLLEHTQPPAAREKMRPLAPQRFGLQVTLDQETHDLLQQARALMGHQVPTGEIAPVIKCALQFFVNHLEQRKYAATTRPGHARRTASARHIPAAVKRAVWERDGGRCTFVSEGGRRCPERTRLEFDHQQPVARGGQATAENLHLVCRVHNQYAAERTFGAAFMERKRAEAQRAGHRGEGAGVLRRRTGGLTTGP
jgi:5-methylcytosine-specific restriction endonuclease McrA